jgi:DNA-binding transcriptional regulator YdaS (Cro superfamily)
VPDHWCARGELPDARPSVALELGCDRREAWGVLNGYRRAPLELRPALERLLGVDQAAIVIDAIPQHPRARAPASAAVEALHSVGATAVDVAPLIPVAPATVRKWLRGKLRPSPEHAAALAGALEQLVGAGTAAEIISLIPTRNGIREERR